ncbi:MAG TPA: hypothetical protein VLT47_11115 [Anaeromyxobacteraceae bacterium]|nr:hypothetical protein [Anaeromyxobacteraceae bacterium]
MGVSYSAGVFFGACVARNSKAGKKLDRYINRHMGSPAPTESPLVMIGDVGNHMTGERWLTVEALGSSREFQRDQETPAPELLTEDPAWRPALAEFLTKIGAPYLSVGWHFQATVM